MLTDVLFLSQVLRGKVERSDDLTCTQLLQEADINSTSVLGAVADGVPVQVLAEATSVLGHKFLNVRAEELRGFIKVGYLRKDANSVFTIQRDDRENAALRKLAEENSQFVDGAVISDTVVQIVSDVPTTGFVLVSVKACEGWMLAEHVKLPKQRQVKRKARCSEPLSEPSSEDDGECPIDVGAAAHIPSNVFDGHTPPNGEFWEAVTCAENEDGARCPRGGVWLRVSDEPIFSRTRTEVAGWLV